MGVFWLTARAPQSTANEPHILPRESMTGRAGDLTVIASTHRSSSWLRHCRFLQSVTRTRRAIQVRRPLARSLRLEKISSPQTRIDLFSWLIEVARWACIPFSIIGGLLCFCWSSELWKSRLGGLFSLILWCLSPNILAHGSLITPDCAAAALGLGSDLFWRWLRRRCWSRAVACGLSLGIAELTTVDMDHFVSPVSFVMGSLQENQAHRCRRSDREPEPSVVGEVSQLGTLLLVGLLVLNLRLWFRGNGYGASETTHF